MSSIVRAPLVGDERAVLVGMLREQRQLLRWKLADGDDEVMRTAVTPSGLGLHGLVSHLTNVERWWFRDVFAGTDGLAYDWTDDDPDGEFRVSTPMPALLDAHAAECARCDAVVDASSLDEVGVREQVSLRWVVAHMIEENARHLGHVDLLREQADGAVGDMPVDARR